MKQNELLFDTTALIDIYRGVSGIQPTFEAILKNKLAPFISVITEAELWRGLHPEEVERHTLILEQFIILPITSDEAQLAGVWMQKYTSTGLGWMDALISATGRVAGLTVLTRDKKLAKVLSSETKFEIYEF